MAGGVTGGLLLKELEPKSYHILFQKIWLHKKLSHIVPEDLVVQKAITYCSGRFGCIKSYHVLFQKIWIYKKLSHMFQKIWSEDLVVQRAITYCSGRFGCTKSYHILFQKIWLYKVCHLFLLAEWKSTNLLIRKILFRLLTFTNTTVWKVSKYRVFSGLYFPAFGLNTKIYEVNPNTGKYEPEKTPKQCILRECENSMWKTWSSSQKLAQCLGNF